MEWNGTEGKGKNVGKKERRKEGRKERKKEKEKDQRGKWEGPSKTRTGTSKGPVSGRSMVEWGTGSCSWGCHVLRQEILQEEKA